MSDTEAVVRWLAIVSVLAAAFAPLAWWLCRPLTSRGAGVVVPLAMLAAVWPGWFMSAGFGLPFASWMPWATVVASGAVGWALLARQRALDRRRLAFLAITAGCWLVLFLAAVWVRGFTPDLTGTEKPMDAAFLSASTIASRMPPADPWFAGQPINYYYLGYVLFGTPARMAGIPATTAYNLAIPTLFASSFMAAACFGWDAVRPWTTRRLALTAATAAGIGLALAGNLYAPLAILRNGAAAIDAWWWDTAVGIGWRSSRIVCDGPRIDGACAFPAVETINEFPFFSFLLADLHPHLMALPLTLLVLTLALARYTAGPVVWRSRVWAWPVAAGAIAGALYAANSWDFPTVFVALLGAAWLANRDKPMRVLREAGLMVVAALVAWFPFWTAFDPPTGGAVTGLPGWLAGIPVLPRLLATFGMHAGERTSIIEFATIFGIPLLLCGWLLASGVRRSGADSEDDGRFSLPIWLVGFVGGLALLAVLLRGPVLLLAGGYAAIALWLLVRGRLDPPRTVATALVALGSILCAGVELIYIRDVFDSRMNTLFKIYYQAWTLYALAGAIALALLWSATRAPVPRAGLALATGLAAVALLAYPVVATRQWTEGFADWRGLDGVAFARNAYPDEHAAILWLRENAGPGDVVLEAAGCSYQPNGDLPFNRVSAYSGVPTVIGWANHERQWRGGQPGLLDGIAPRQADVARIFAEPNGSLAGEYGIDWLYVGRYEAGDWTRICEVAGPYAGIEARRFPGSGWSLAFDSATVRIWHRVAAD